MKFPFPQSVFASIRWLRVSPKRPKLREISELPSLVWLAMWVWVRSDGLQEITSSGKPILNCRVATRLGSRGFLTHAPIRSKVTMWCITNWAGQRGMIPIGVRVGGTKSGLKAHQRKAQSLQSWVTVVGFHRSGGAAASELFAADVSLLATFQVAHFWSDFTQP